MTAWCATSGRVARASGVTIDLDWQLLRRRVRPAAVAGGAALGRPERDAMRWVLGGGEDHALAATFPAGVALPDGFVPVGEVLPAIGRAAARPAGRRAAATSLGWDHFRE